MLRTDQVYSLDLHQSVRAKQCRVASLRSGAFDVALKCAEGIAIRQRAADNIVATAITCGVVTGFSQTFNDSNDGFIVS